MKEHFNEYTELYNRIKELNYKLETMARYLYDPKAVSYGEQIRSTNPKTLCDRLSDKGEIEEEITRLQQQKRKLYDKHIKEISLIADERKRRILRSYYLDKMSIYDISSMLCITEKRLYVLKREADNEFKEKILQNG